MRIPGDAVDRFLNRLPEPLPYWGYTLGDVVFGWTGPVSPAGHAHLLVIAGPGRDLIVEDALVESVSRARDDAMNLRRQAFADAGGTAPGGAEPKGGKPDPEPDEDPGGTEPDSEPGTEPDAEN